MVAKLYIFNMKIQLKYCTYDLYSDKKESEFVMGLRQDVIWEKQRCVEEPIPDKNLAFRKQENIRFRLTCGNEKENNSMPKDYFDCEISNIVAHNKKEALDLIKSCLYKICRTISFLMSRHNCNKHSYQPRVEADMDNVVWEVKPYVPFDKVIHKKDVQVEEQIIDGKSYQVITLEMAPITISTEVYTKIYGRMSIDDFDLYTDCEDLDINYMLDEFYLALGQENVNSKFFHLFSIIEFAEEKYKHLDGAKKILEDTEVEAFLKYIDDYPKLADKGLRLRVHDRLKGALSQMTDYGRNRKLVNILHSMNILKIEGCGTAFDINVKVMRELTDLRNIFYHGNRDGIVKSDHISMELAVSRLLYICEQIIEYVIKNETPKLY